VDGGHFDRSICFNQLMEFPEVREIFFIGANGKIGNAVCSLLLGKRPEVKICILSKNRSMNHPNISYTENIQDMLKYQVVVVGKILPGPKYILLLSGSSDPVKTKLVLDYSVPFIPLHFNQHPQIKHVQIGLIESTDRSFLRGPFDVCMSHDQNHIYPVMRAVSLTQPRQETQMKLEKYSSDDVKLYWEKALSYGLRNRDISNLI